MLAQVSPGLASVQSLLANDGLGFSDSESHIIDVYWDRPELLNQHKFTIDIGYRIVVVDLLACDRL